VEVQIGCIKSTHPIKVIFYNTNTYKKVQKHRQTRGEVDVWHWGFWRKYSCFVTKTIASRSKFFHQWRRVNNFSFLKISKKFQEWKPKLHKKYIACIRKWKIGSYFGPWATCVLNYNYNVTDHFDRDDYKDGWCFVYIWGKWKNGGDLVFPEWNVTIKCEPNMLIAFPSKHILHRVSPYLGKRYSMVFFTGNAMFY
jgi:hypothetical protein